MAIVVQKYGGSSVADADKIKNVARRAIAAQEKGKQVVVVVSAMGKTTDNLIKLAQQVTDEPDERELDFLLSTGEIVSCTLLAMALKAMDHQAISLSGAQAGIKTDAVHSRARILGIDPRRITKELNKGNEGLIITHGTDALHFTAAALSFMLKGLNKPVIVDNRPGASGQIAA